jgi:hypothetical protein
VAAEPDHLAPQGAAEVPRSWRWTGLRSHSLAAQLFALLAPATPFELSVIRVHQHFLFLFLNCLCLRNRPAGRCYALRWLRRGGRA